ncbi:MAG: DUF1501 domain-containing protein [Betaproteobacteria bacterium]|nr:DUF1501 domain-containing protein [Betaproteobacteria bacterium]
MLRRRFLLSTPAAACAGSASLLWPGWSDAWAGAPIQARSKAAPKLVVVMLRGAVDGLSVVVPHGDTGYQQARESIALAAPSSAEGTVLPLDRLFGLHPALERLMPLWNRGLLGFVHASGSPDPTRSHFDAQDYMESGTPGRKSTPDGWMNRLLSHLPGPASTTRALNMGATPARIFAGPATVASLGLGPRAMDAKAIDNPELQAALARLYASDGSLARTFQETTQSRIEMSRTMAAADARNRQARREAEMAAAAPGDNGRSSDPSADAGAPTARGFAADALRLGQLIQADPHTQLAFTSVGGWDTHVNQGGARGALANRLGSLGLGLESLIQGLGDALEHTVIVVMSEFGRTVRQNGTGGTDHGRGNVMWLLGGPVAGGHVRGEWPGLDRAALADGRDLAVTTDFRGVLSPVLQQHLGLGDAAMDQVFPGFSGPMLKEPVLRS